MSIAHYLSESCRLARKIAQGALVRLGFVLSTRSLVFLKLDVTALDSAAPGEPAVQPISAADVRAQARYFDGWYTREKALQRLEQGCELFAFADGGANVCFGWAERRSVINQWMRLQLQLPEGVVYLGGLYTVPEARGRGMALRFWSSLAHRCKAQGAKHLLVNIDPQNTASLRLHRKLGFREYQIVHFKRFGLIRYYRVQSAHTAACRRWLTLFHCPPELWKTFWAEVSAARLDNNTFAG